MFEQTDAFEIGERLTPLRPGKYSKRAAQRRLVTETAAEHVVDDRQPLGEIELLKDHTDLTAHMPEVGGRKLQNVDRTAVRSAV
ncbi:hypothetical protein D3C83_123320 [compost metagenome]